MSLESFLKKIWAGIRSIFEDFPADLKVAVATGVVVAENMKNFVDSPAADVITALIPGTADDALKALLREKLPAIVTDLKLVQATEGVTDADLITANAIKVLKDMDPSLSGPFLHNIAVMVAQVAADGKLSWSDGVHVLEWYYQNVFKAA